MAHRVLAVVATVLVSSLAAVTGGPAHAQTTTAHDACATSARWQCRAQVIEPATGGTTGNGRAPRSTSASGYTAARLQAAYGVDGTYEGDTVPTIAVIDAYDYPNAAADLAT